MSFRWRRRRRRRDMHFRRRRWMRFRRGVRTRKGESKKRDVHLRRRDMKTRKCKRCDGKPKGHRPSYKVCKQ
jgi:hypothetical protein